MLVSAVLDPSAFDPNHFDESYRMHAEDFLKGIEKNGVLIVDSRNRLRDALVKQVESLPIKYGQRLRILAEEILLKKRSKRIIVCSATPNDPSSRDLLDLAYCLKTDTEADALVVGNEGPEKLISARRFGEDIVRLSEYRDSDFERGRQQHENQVGPVDTLPKGEVEELIIRSVRFTKWLRFYDRHVGTGNNTSDFRRGIQYILSLWQKYGYFADERGIGSIEIFTCSAEQIRDDETDQAKTNKLTRNQESYEKIIRELIDPLKKDFSHWWQIKVFVKDDPNRIFHARFLETQHAIIQVDLGFDLFKSNGEFKRNFFILNMSASSHLRECRDLSDANVLPPEIRATL